MKIEEVIIWFGFFTMFVPIFTLLAVSFQPWETIFVVQRYIGFYLLIVGGVISTLLITFTLYSVIQLSKPWSHTTSIEKYLNSKLGISQDDVGSYYRAFPLLLLLFSLLLFAVGISEREKTGELKIIYGAVALAIYAVLLLFYYILQYCIHWCKTKFD